MIGPLLALAAAAATTPGQAVRQLYVDACVSGSLRIAPGQGKAVKLEDLPAVPRGVATANRPVRSATFIAMREPPATYVLMTEFEHTPVNAAKTSCMVVSQSINLDDAYALLMTSNGGVQPDPAINSRRFDNYWLVNKPRQGYRQALWQTRDWIGLESETVRRPGEPER